MRSKKIALNGIVEFFLYAIIGVLGILKVRYIIIGIGSELNGYYQFVNQIIAYLFLVEAGIGGAILYKFYKPIANLDKTKIARLFNGAKYIFRKIALIIFIILIFVAVGMYFYIDNNEIAITITISLLVLTGSRLISFFVASKAYIAIMGADQKRYVYSLILNIFRIVLDMFIVFLIIKYKNLIILVVITFVVKVFEEVVIIFIGRRMYPYLKKIKGKDLEAQNMTKDMVYHHVGSLILNNTDPIILMFFLGPIWVSIYGAYNYVVIFLRELFKKGNAAIIHSFGSVFAKEEIDKSYTLFKEYITFILISAIITSLTFIFGIKPFVDLWIGNSLYLLNYVTIVAFGAMFYAVIVYTPFHSIIMANGLYKESKYYSFIEAFINIILSLILVSILGLSGILFATFIASFIGIGMKLNLIKRLVFKNVSFKEIIYKYVFSVILFFGGILLIYFIRNIIFVNVSSFMVLCLLLFSFFIVISIIVINIFMVFDRENTLKVINRIKQSLGSVLGR